MLEVNSSICNIDLAKAKMEALIGSFKRFLSEIIKLSYKKWTWACDHLKTINLSAENLKNSSPQWVGKYKLRSTWGRFCEPTRLSTPPRWTRVTLSQPNELCTWARDTVSGYPILTAVNLLLYGCPQIVLYKLWHFTSANTRKYSCTNGQTYRRGDSVRAKISRVHKY